MHWIDINHYKPGNMVYGDIMVRLSNGEKQMLYQRNIDGVWFAKDGITKAHVTHWMVIEEPK